MMYLVITHEAGEWRIKLVTADQEVAWQLAEEASGVVCPVPVERDWRKS